MKKHPNASKPMTYLRDNAIDYVSSNLTKTTHPKGKNQDESLDLYTSFCDLSRV